MLGSISLYQHAEEGRVVGSRVEGILVVSGIPKLACSRPTIPHKVKNTWAKEI